MKWRRCWWLVGVAFAPLAWLACNALAGITEPNVVDGAGVCTHSRPPLPPNGVDTGDGGLAIAIRHMSFGEISAGEMKPPAPGYDLDGVCTCPGDPSCAPLLAGFSSCDLGNGADNAFLGLYANYSSILGMEEVNDRIGNGGFGFLITLEGYNGLPDDPVVRVSFLSSTWSLVHPAGTFPTWTGTDEWGVDSVSYVDASVPRAVDPTAYVSNGVLVASLPSVALLLLMSGIPMRFEVTEASLTGRLSIADGGLYSLAEGQFTGRIPIESMLSVVASLPMLGQGSLCASAYGYSAVRAEVCKRADILRHQGGAPAASCDAMSFVFAFDGVQAVQGAAIDVPQVDAGACAPGTRFDCVGVDY